MKFLIPALALLVSAASAEIVTLAHPGEALPEKSTVVWSPLFQAAWEKLDADPGEPTEKAVTLNLHRWDAGQVTPEGSWKKWTGPETPDFLKQVNDEQAAITGGKIDPFSLAKAEDQANQAVFSLLDRDVEFQEVFVRSRNAALDFQVGELSHPVHFFGIRYIMSKSLGDARVLAYRPVDHSHALQFRGKAADESVIVYLPAKPQNFATACNWIRTWKTPLGIDDPRMAGAPLIPPGAWNDPSLHTEDEIRIPAIDLVTQTGVIGHRDDKPGSIFHIEQITRFQLHEKAAHLPDEVLNGAVDPFADLPPPGYPRKFIYDRPFFVFLWRDGAEWPYFGAWIGDASALKAFP